MGVGGGYAFGGGYDFEPRATLAGRIVERIQYSDSRFLKCVTMYMNSTGRGRLHRPV